jgi:peptidyl-prolyl cis-trans isomerase D
MFDLFRSRAKAVRYLLGGLLGIVALSMVITLIPGFGTPNTSADNVIAEIGKGALTVREVQNEMQQLVRNRQIPSDLVAVYLPQRIDQMIMERAVAYQAEQLGYKVTDAELASTIRSVLPKFFLNGLLIDKASYEQFLLEQGYTIPEFEANLRKQMVMTRLMNVALEGIVVTPDEVKREYDRRNARLKIAYVGFKAEDLKSQVKPSAQELEAYYNANKEGFREPEKKDIVVLVADQDKMAAALTVPDDQLRRAYEQNKDNFRTPERVKVRHVLLMTTGKSADEVNKIKAKAEDLRKQINDKNFADLAKANSEDPGSKDKGGDLGWIVRGQTVKNFENASFTMKPGEISPVITTEYGFHIIQVQEKEQARLKPFEEVRDQLATDVKRAQLADRVQNGIEQARAALIKAPTNYAQIAQQFGLEVVKAEKVAPGAPVGTLGTNPELETAAAGLKLNEVSPVFQLGPTRLGVAEITAITPSRVATFAEAEPKIRENFVSTKVQALVAERSAAAATRIKAGEDIQKVAKELGGTYSTPPEFNSEGAIEGLGAATTFSDAFGKPAGAVLGPLNVAGQMVVAKVVESIPADPSMLNTQRDSIVLGLKQKKSTERKDLFQDSILAKLLKDGKVKKHQDTINRLLASYRG